MARKVMKQEVGIIYQKPNGTYHYRYQINGERKSISLKTKNQEEAKRKVKELLPVLKATSIEKEIDTSDFTLGDWFWIVKHNPSTWFHSPCREQFTKPMWWSLLYSSADLLPDCPCLDQFSDEDWRRLNIVPKLKNRIRTREQFQKLIDLTRYPFRNSRFDE